MAELKRTPIFDLYKEYGAKTIDFGGWELPVQFSSIKEEHEAVRTKVGLFDVSHMGEITVKGTGSLAYLQKMLTNDVGKINNGAAQYTAMCYENGGTVDDLITYKLAEDDYVFVVNASNIEKDYQWLKEHLEGDVQLDNRSEQIAQLALQGPLAERVIAKLVSETPLEEIGPFEFKNEVDIAGKKALISRTGYTGEDGFEIYCAQKDASEIWNAILAAGKEMVSCQLDSVRVIHFVLKQD